MSTPNVLQISSLITGEQIHLHNMSTKAKAGLDYLRASTKANFDGVWRNPDFTPAQMIAAMGTNARQNFERHAATIQYLLYMGLSIPSSEYTPLQAYTVQADGTIVLTA
jgi:hypothetical protein